MQTLTCLIAITTPREKDHFFSVMTRMTDPVTKKPLYNVLRIGEPCENCAKTATPWTCDHNFEEDAPWKSRRKIKKYEQFYVEQGLEHIHMREQFGQESDNVDRAFTSESIEQLMNKPVFKVEQRPKIIFMSGDPSGAGKSAYGIAGAFFDKGDMIINLLDAAPMRTGTLEEERDRLQTAVRLLRKQKVYKGVPILYIPENDPGKQTSHAPYFLRKFKDILTMQECSGRKFGVPKQPFMTADMQYKLRDLLNSGGVSFAHNLVSVNHKPKDVVKILHDQMKAYMWNIDDKGKVELTGKKGGKNDDLMVAVMMIPYWRQMFYDDNTFLPYVQFKRFVAQCAGLSKIQ